MRQPTKVDVPSISHPMFQPASPVKLSHQFVIKLQVKRRCLSNAKEELFEVIDGDVIPKVMRKSLRAKLQCFKGKICVFFQKEYQKLQGIDNE